MDDQLKKAAVKGVGWAFLSSTAVRLIQVITTLVLAKLLIPDDFGVFALASIVVNALIVFRDLGFAQVLIYQQGDVRQTAGTAFTLSLMASLVMALGLAAAAPALGELMNSRQVVGPIRAMAGALFVSGAANVPLALLDRELRFKLRAVPELGGAAANGAVAITLAALGFGAWSMVLGWIALEVVVTVLGLAVCPWKPRLGFDREQAKVVIGYGKHLMVASLLVFAFFNVDKFSIGTWIGERQLGFYSLAFTVCNLPATNLTHVINRVMFPTYSRLQGDIAEMGAVYLSTIRYISLAAFPGTAAIIVLAGPVINTFYGSKWAPAIPLFYILAVYGLIRSIGCTATAVFMSTGRPGLASRVSLIHLAFALPLVYPAAVRFGAMGVAVCFTIAYAAGSLYALGMVRCILGISVRGYMAAVALPLSASALAGTMSWIAFHSPDRAGALAVAGTAAIMAAAYGAFVWLLDRSSFRGMFALLTSSSRAGGAS